MASTAVKTITVSKSLKSKVDEWNRNVKKLNAKRHNLLKRKDFDSKSYEKDVLSFKAEFEKLQKQQKAIREQAKRKGLITKLKK